MSRLNSLVAVMRPPKAPIDAPNQGDWESIERTLGLELPKDYQEFVTLYGTGALDNFLWVLNPFSRNKYFNLIEQARTRLDAQRRFSEQTGIANPYVLHPEPEGLFPLSVTDNGDVVYWLCKGLPSTWNVVVCDSRASRWQAFNQSAGEFLLGVVTKKMRVDCFPIDFPSESPTFIVN